MEQNTAKDYLVLKKDSFKSVVCTLSMAACNKDCRRCEKAIEVMKGRLERLRGGKSGGVVFKNGELCFNSK